MEPVSVDLLETEFLRVQSVPWIVPLLPFFICRFQRLGAPPCHSDPLVAICGEGAALYLPGLFSFPLRPCASEPSLFLCAHDASFSSPFLVSFVCPLCVVRCSSHMVLGATSEGHAGASGLTALASCGLARRRGLARQRGPTFTAVVDGWTSLLCWCRGVSRRRCPLFLHPFSPFGLD